MTKYNFLTGPNLVTVLEKWPLAGFHVGTTSLHTGTDKFIYRDDGRVISVRDADHIILALERRLLGGLIKAGRVATLTFDGDDDADDVTYAVEDEPSGGWIYFSGPRGTALLEACVWWQENYGKDQPNA